MSYNYDVIINHVLPINDIEEHITDIEWVLGFTPVCKCKCMPKSSLDPDTIGWIIIHSSFDGREALEEFNAIVNPPKQQ